MPTRAATARKLSPPKPPTRKAKPKPKAKKKKAAPKPKKTLLTPSEKEKMWMAVGLLAFCLLAVLIHSGECVHTASGWKIHFHDLRGDLLVSVKLPF